MKGNDSKGPKFPEKNMESKFPDNMHIYMYTFRSKYLQSVTKLGALV